MSIFQPTPPSNDFGKRYAVPGFDLNDVSLGEAPHDPRKWKKGAVCFQKLGLFAKVSHIGAEIIFPQENELLKGLFSLFSLIFEL